MGKFFKSSDDVIELIDGKFDECGLASYGLNLKVISTTKSKDLFSVSKESVKTEFLTSTIDLITVIVNENVFDRLDEDSKNMLIEMVLSGISYDSEKDKIFVDKNQINLILNMRRKYGDVILDKIELVQHIFNEIAEEEREKKRIEKEAKKAKKNN